MPEWERSINKWFDAHDDYCMRYHTKKTRNVRRTIVNGFIGFYRLPTFRQRGKRRNIDGFKESNKREGLTREDIRMMLEASKSLKMKAIILVQVSSGLAAADLLKLKIGDFVDGLMTVQHRRVCKLKCKRQKTRKRFTTFISHEGVESVEKYLELERVNVERDDALFSNRKKSGEHMKHVTLLFSYLRLNEYLGWQTGKGEYSKATSHMMRKYFNTKLTYAGMPEEIREHFMGHVINNKVRDAYFLENDEELARVYLDYMDKLRIMPENEAVHVSQFNDFASVSSSSEIEQLKNIVLEMQKEINKLTDAV